MRVVVGILGLVSALWAGSWRAWTFNDNLSGDDFLSFGAGLEREWGPWQLELSAAGLTSKALGYRYDLIHYQINYLSHSPRRSLELGLGLYQRAQLGGALIQNQYHQSIGMSTTDLPYDPAAMGISLDAQNWNKLNPWVQVGFQMRLAPLVVSSQMAGAVLHQGSSSALDYSLGLGFRQILSRARHYSEMERSGALGFGQLRLNLWGPWHLEGGAQYLPVQNYQTSNRRLTALRGYQCQSWMALSVGFKSSLIPQMLF